MLRCSNRKAPLLNTPDESVDEEKKNRQAMNGQKFEAVMGLICIHRLPPVLGRESGLSGNHGKDMISAPRTLLFYQRLWQIVIV
jgi:hypothetical protein